ncbi:MAG: hypothetical protein ACI9YG_001527, partial [Candidatus Azotimanducaceae bacterium]
MRRANVRIKSAGRTDASSLHRLMWLIYCAISESLDRLLL